ncbi:MAG: DUF3048 domain-containing protein [Firmicutes bacterium]|nr:DUF3048 domain-containing protein [Bacillota bacterium]
MKKKYFIIIIIFTMLSISGAAVALYWPKLSPPKKVKVSPKKKETPNITVPEVKLPEAYCPLDDESTTAQNSMRRPLAVMIENHPDARPQSGLTKACIVYETVAEGGITRFLAIYVHNDVRNIGPVRSARSYFVDLAKQYNAIYAHCGGPTTIHNIIRRLGVADLDEFANSKAYWRVKTRHAPHNLYTSTDRLIAGAQARKYDTNLNTARLSFKEDVTIDLRPAGASIDIDFSKAESKVRYVYDRQTNQYNRLMAGQPHVDADTNQQIAPKNVIVQYVSISKIANDIKGRMQVDLVGSGKAVVFQDGAVIQAIWQRPTVGSITRYYDLSGSEIKLNRGQTWIELVDPYDMKVNYQIVPMGATAAPTGN